MYEFNNSFISCTLSGFFLRIADPKIGGTYATMLFCTSSFGV
jgi:PAT family acetyl-CoA transporter-like MFS transporter 1